MVRRSQKIVWIRYHSSMSSSAQLVKRMMGEFPERTKIGKALRNQINADDKAWYEEALKPENSNDRAIHSNPPSALLAITHAYLKAMGTLPDQTWWQGDRAVAEMSPMAYLNYFGIFTIIRKKMSISGDSIDVKTDEEIAMAISGDDYSSAVQKREIR